MGPVPLPDWKHKSSTVGFSVLVTHTPFSNITPAEPDVETDPVAIAEEEVIEFDSLVETSNVVTLLISEFVVWP